MSKHIFRGLTVLLIVVSVTLLAAVPVLAADFRGGDSITVASGEVIDDDLYLAGNRIIIDGIVNGDLWAVGNITINGKVNGSVMAAGETIDINGEVTGTVRAAGGTLNIRGHVDGDLLVAGGQVNIASTARIGRDLLFGAGNVRIDGPIEGYIKGGGGEVTVTNGVGEDIELQVDKLTVASTANIQGNLTYTSDNKANIQSGAQIGGTTTHQVPEVEESAKAGPLSGIVGKVVAFLMTLLAGIVIILVAPRRAASVAASLRRKPWLSLGWGAIILFATPIAAIVTLVTVVGVPVSLIGLTLYGIGIYLSQIAVGLFIGYWIVRYFSKGESRGILIGALTLGFLILTLLKLIPYVGFPLWLATVLFGIGAMALSQKTLPAEGAEQPNQLSLKDAAKLKAEAD